MVDLTGYMKSVFELIMKLLKIIMKSLKLSRNHQNNHETTKKIIIIFTTEAYFLIAHNSSNQNYNPSQIQTVVAPSFSHLTMISKKLN